jgi:predicted nucleic acid-binding protein
MEKIRYVFDTSAFMTLFEDEDGADSVQNLLEQAKQGEIDILTSFVSFIEVFYIALREEGEETAKKRIRLMDMLPIKRVESSQESGFTAGRLKAENRISFADTWVAATAIFYNAVLVHKVPEFEQLSKKIRLLQLPCKK